MKKTIYLVIGESGEYSDHTEWNIAAFEDKEKAEKLAEMCRREVTRLRTDHGSLSFHERLKYKSRYDIRVDAADCRWSDDDGDTPKYGVCEVDLLDEVPE